MSLAELVWEDRDSYPAGLLRDVQRAAMRLAEAATLGRADIERAVHAIDIPPASEPLLELVIGTPRIDAMSVLLSSLVLRRSVRGTPHQDPWLAIFARTAETVIFELRLLGLFDLRLELLDEIITQPPQRMSLAALHFERANTRRVLAGQDRDAMRVVWEDLQIAIAQAQQEGNADIYAGSIAFQAKFLAGSAEDIRDRVAAGAALAEQIREMLATLPALDPFRRMQLLQARAALTRTSRPMEAIEALEVAMAMSALGDPLRVEMAAELVSVLDAAGRQALLLRKLACAWSSDDHAAAPVRDFLRAAELLRRAVALEGGESAAPIDTMGYLARALRYAEDSTDTSLRESRRLYRLLLERVRAEGDPDRIANILHNLAEIEAHLGEGDRDVRRLFGGGIAGIRSRQDREPLLLSRRA